MKGVNKGTYYIINPVLLKRAEANAMPTTLKLLEPSVLESLILKDISIHPDSKISEIASRLPDIALKEVRKVVYLKVKEGDISYYGAKTNRRYFITNNGGNKKNN